MAEETEIIRSLESDVGKVVRVAVEYRDKGGIYVPMLCAGLSKLDKLWTFVESCNEHADTGKNYIGARVSVDKISLSSNPGYFINCRNESDLTLQDYYAVTLDDVQEKLWEERSIDG